MGLGLGQTRAAFAAALYPLCRQLPYLFALLQVHSVWHIHP